MRYIQLPARIFLLCTFCFFFTSTQSLSQFANLQSSPVEDSTYTKYGLLLSYQLFQTEEMKETYTGVFGVHVGRTQWIWDMVGLRLAGGVIGGEGKPIVLNSPWQINTADIGFWAIDVEASLVMRFMDGNPQSSITPFIGIGGEGYGGIEKLSVSKSRNDTLVQGDASALFGTVGGHALAGVYLPLTAENAIQIELKYLYTINGSYKDLLSEKDKAEFQEKIYSVVSRPTISFTGFSAGLVFFF